jgi:protein TonB
MTPLTKETLEATNSATQSSAPRTAAPASAHLHSEAVSLEIPIKVHGSRVTEVVRDTTPHTEPFEEQTTTMIVFAQGGVLKMSTPVSTGQMMVLTNLKTRQDVICRVLKVRNNPSLQAYVEIEFTHPQPGYWGVFFPSDAPEVAPRTPAPVQSLNLAPEAEESMSQEVSRPFAPPPNLPGRVIAKPPVAITPQSPVAPKPGSAFISIGSQEEVQVAASSTLAAKRALLLESAKENRAAGAPASTNPSIVELQGDPQSATGISAAIGGAIETEPPMQLSVEPSTANTKSTFGEFGAGPGSVSSREMFGSSLGVSGAGTSAHTAGPRRNWLLIAACAALAIAAAGGAAAYFYNAPASKGTATTVSAIPPAPDVETSQNPASQSSQVNQTPYAIPAAPAPAVNDAPTTTKANTTGESKVIVTDHSEAGASPVQAASNVTPRLMAKTLNARPVAPKRARTNQADAPALDAGIASIGDSNALAGIPGSSNALPPPPPASVARTGGVLTAPKLISSIPPVYPRAAQQAMMDGDVVIHAVIDKSGSVSEATVISGPTMLRNAALDAVRRWKYSPSILDGQAVDSQTTVTVKFRH